MKEIYNFTKTIVVLCSESSKFKKLHKMTLQLFKPGLTLFGSMRVVTSSTPKSISRSKPSQSRQSLHHKLPYGVGKLFLLMKLAKEGLKSIVQSWLLHWGIKLSKAPWSAFQAPLLLLLEILASLAVTFTLFRRNSTNYGFTVAVKQLKNKWCILVSQEEIIVETKPFIGAAGTELDTNGQYLACACHPSQIRVYELIRREARQLVNRDVSTLLPDVTFVHEVRVNSTGTAIAFLATDQEIVALFELVFISLLWRSMTS